MKARAQYKKGFTIVELLIVIVVIAILAAISVVAYNGIQQRGRDTQRKSDLQAISKAVELYYVDNGKYPMGGTSWCTQISNTSNGYKAGFQSAIAPYLAKISYDPQYEGTPLGYFYRKVSDNSYFLYAELESSDVADDGFAGCTRVNSENNEYDYRIPAF